MPDPNRTMSLGDGGRTRPPSPMFVDAEDLAPRIALIVRAARNLLTILEHDGVSVSGPRRIDRAAADLRNVLAGTAQASPSEREPAGYLDGLRAAADFARDVAHHGTPLLDPLNREPVDQVTALRRLAAGLATMVLTAEERLGSAAHDERQPTRYVSGGRHSGMTDDEARAALAHAREAAEQARENWAAEALHLAEEARRAQTERVSPAWQIHVDPVVEADDLPPDPGAERGTV